MFLWTAKARLESVFNELISRLNEALERLECVIYRAKSYRKELYVRYLVAYSLGDGLRASMYISEVVEVERMLKSISRAYLLLERSIIRLTILSEVYEFLPVNSMEDLERLKDFTSDINLNMVKNLQKLSIELLRFFDSDLDFLQLNREKIMDGEAVPVYTEAP